MDQMSLMQYRESDKDYTRVCLSIGQLSYHAMLQHLFHVFEKIATFFSVGNAGMRSRFVINR